MHRDWKNKRGLTLTELLVALAMSSLIIAGLYRTFIGQQRTYTVQEQTVEMRQNARGAISNMSRELRMAGFGAVGMVLPVQLGGNTYSNIVNRNTPVAGSITIVSGLLTPDSKTSTLTSIDSPTQITVTVRNRVSSVPDFDTVNKKYISIGGIESNIITGMTSANGVTVFTLNNKLNFSHAVGTLIYPIRAISYYVAR